MTDRVQPGGIDSIIRSDEVAQIFGQFSEGWVVDQSPTTAATRRANIDETALNSFALTSTSGLDVTIAPGEAFVSGWCARDVSTTISLPANTTSTIVVGWDLDSVFDPSVDATRDAADETIVDRQSVVDPQYPVTELFDITTNGSGVIDFTDRRRLGPTVAADTIDATDAVSLPVYDSELDIPSLDEGTLAYLTLKESVVVDVGRLLVGDASFTGATVDVGIQTSFPRDIQFSTEGEDMFVMGNGNNQVFQFDVNDPFSVSTASFSGASFDVSSQETSPQAVAFADDGARMFIVGNNSANVSQFDLSTPFDLSSTVSFSSNFDVSPQEGTPHGIVFSADGTKMFITGASAKVYQYSLGTSFDVSGSVSFATSFDVSTQDSFATGVDFADDGTQMFILGVNTGNVYQYSLDTAFDVSFGVANTARFDFSSQTSNVDGFQIPVDNNRMVVINGSNDKLLEYVVPSTKSV